jgi:hypothetical protein
VRSLAVGFPVDFSLGSEPIFSTLFQEAFMQQISFLVYLI